MIIPRSWTTTTQRHTDVNIQNKNGWTALMKVCENGDTHVVKILLKGHANINIWTIDGWAAQIIARPSGHRVVVVQLLKRTLGMWTALTGMEYKFYSVKNVIIALVIMKSIHL